MADLTPPSRAPQFAQPLPGAACRLIAAAPPPARPAVETLLALDATLARILQSTSMAMVGQMRLTWWHAALAALATGDAPAEPVLQAIAGSRFRGDPRLLRLVEGWEALLEDPLDAAVVDSHAAARGGALFTLLAEPLHAAGRGWISAAGAAWAAADLAAHLTDPAEAVLARAAARAALAPVPRLWPRALRPLRRHLNGALAAAGLPRHALW